VRQIQLDIAMESVVSIVDAQRRKLELLNDELMFVELCSSFGTLT